MRESCMPPACHRSHRAQIRAHGIVGALWRFLDLGLGQDFLLDLDQLAALTLGLFVGLLVRPLSLFARLLSPSLLVSSVSTTLTPISLNMASTSFLIPFCRREQTRLGHRPRSAR